MIYYRKVTNSLRNPEADGRGPITERARFPNQKLFYDNK
jgi:hypothetical protein